MKRNWGLALMIALAYDAFQFIGEASVVAFVGVFIVPFLIFLQPVVSVILWQLTGSIYPLLGFVPEEIPGLSMLPINTATVVLAKTGGKK